MTVRVLIADDHPIFRRGLREIISSAAGLEVVAEAENGGKALELIEAMQPAIAVLDIHMPVMSGIEVAVAIRDRKLATIPVMLTMYKDEQMFNAARQANVRGYVLKDSAITEIVGCIEAVAAGEAYVTPSLSQFVLKRSGTASVFHLLTPTELRVVRLIADYKTSKEIAAELHIHPRTVDNHRTNAAAKLGVQGTHALLRFVLEHKAEL